MKATQFEFRFRVLIVALLYILGFWAPWTRYGAAAPATTAWLALCTIFARWGWLPLDRSTLFVTGLAILFALAGAALRIWGTSYLGPSVVQSPAMHAGQMMASGPYRYVRNPLYLGTLLFSVGVSILMPPTGALFFLAANVLFYLRLILAEEAYLGTQIGPAYLDYCRRVPRLLPSLRPRMPASPVRAHWLHGVMGEVYPAGFALCLAVLAWRYNPELLIRCVLLCFGLSLITRALLPRERFAGD